VHAEHRVEQPDVWLRRAAVATTAAEVFDA